ncbi:AAA family ATPase [Capilliphycus salinus ALCB114379]|uniref:trifunctional serine/threonine-protein kinase/ATP-binding protein/sensor histidine kinase n=1 Tax=Capilliphycus salinus TaxID=2768948 RepID=UPI0039A60231
MKPIVGYCLSEQIYASSRTLIYRGRREKDRKSVIVKLPRHPYPSFSEIAQYRNAYTLLKNLHHLPGVVRILALENVDQYLALVMEDFGGISLHEQIQKQNKNGLGETAEGMNQFLKIARQMAEILEQLHQNRIIHKDIKPHNVIIQPVSGKIQLIDFTNASQLPRINPEINRISAIEGTLTYISPEQTGRMNRGIDYRSDFYSLGVMFYELLTGKLPFVCDDPMELIHSHIAREPVSPKNRIPEIPEMVSNIVLKLMAKMPEDRYQSGSGIKQDLDICIQQWQAHNQIPNFRLGTYDLSTQFLIPEKLYGREKEVKILLNIFEQTAQGSREMMLVGGSSGVGKSALINEVHKPIVRQRGYFIGGKFDQFQRDIPFSAFVQAFQTLIQQLLSETEISIKRWKASILSALGESGQVIIDVIPELELLIGSQPPIPTLEPTAAENRFKLLFSKFTQVFTTADHPLVIFLDDLQWADLASLKLIQLLMSDPDTCYLFVIGAYRNNEVSPAHPLTLTIDELCNAGVNIHHMSLKPLEFEHLKSWVAQALKCSLTQATSLTKVVYQKTQGNPFFSRQFLNELHQEGFIFPNLDLGYWQWDRAKVESLSLSSDVLDLMTIQLQRLPLETQNILKLAACIGNLFDLETLAIISQNSTNKTANYLWSALKAGLIVPVDEMYKFFPENESETLPENFTVQQQIPRYKFLHDRVQQAAYRLIEPEKKQETHLKIGRLLWREAEDIEREEKIFEITNHLNQGVRLIQEKTERYKLAKLNLITGRKAKISTAYAAAIHFLRLGLELLEEDSWQSHYSLAFELHKERAELEYLNGNFEQAERFIYLTLSHVKTVVEKAEIYNLLVIQHTFRTQYQEAIRVGTTALKLLGFNLSKSQIKTALDAEFIEVQYRLKNLKIYELIDQPELQQPEYKVAIKILSNLEPPAYFTDPDLWSLIVTKMVNISRKYGHISESSFGYATYGLLLILKSQNYQLGYQFVQLAIALSERFQDWGYKCRNCTALVAVINHWVKPMNTISSVTSEGCQAGLEAGELQYSGYILAYQAVTLFYSENNLESLIQKLAEYLVFARKINNQLATNIVLGLILGVKLFLGEARITELLGQEVLNENQYLSLCRDNKTFMGVGFYRILKTQALFMLGKFDQAQDSLEEAHKFTQYIPGFISIAQLNLFESLILTHLDSQTSSQQKPKHQSRIQTNLQQMKIWAENCPENFEAPYLLILAEQARIQGQYWDALEYYDRAIAAAKQHGWVQQEALANEQAALFCLKQGRERFAQTYMIEAYYCYVRWGAAVKIKQLERDYSQLLSPIVKRDNNNMVNSSTSKTNTSVNHSSASGTGTHSLLDLATVIKAFHALSSKIKLNSLLSTLVQLAIENAGAQKCALILDKDNQLILEAIAHTSSTDTTSDTHQSLDSFERPLIPVNLSQDLPQSLINYVWRSQKSLVLDEATDNPFWVSDPYMNKQQPKSILCTPVSKQGQLIGILYLENNLVRGAFTSERLQLLELITTQAAISLENARLYDNLAIAKSQLEATNQTLEQKVQQRTQELHENNQCLAKTLEELQRTQTQLIQTEKMSSLGQLVAGVAHEINNPVNFIFGNITHAQEYAEDLLEVIKTYQQYYPAPAEAVQDLIEEVELDFLLEDFPKLLNSMEMGANRIREIVESLRNFSRLDEAEVKSVNIHEGIDSTLMILHNRLKAKPDEPAIEVIKNYGDLPTIECYPGQLNQVFMNILSNAIDALQQKRKETGCDQSQITITTEVTTDQKIKIKIADNGLGMSEKVQKQIFDPFFTTKPVGKGTGLGLAISYQIVVDRHQGQLSCISTPNEGTELIVEIPLRQL